MAEAAALAAENARLKALVAQQQRVRRGEEGGCVLFFCFKFFIFSCNDACVHACVSVCAQAGMLGCCWPTLIIEPPPVLCVVWRRPAAPRLQRATPTTAPWAKPSRANFKLELNGSECGRPRLRRAPPPLTLRSCCVVYIWWPYAAPSLHAPCFKELEFDSNEQII